MVAPSSRFTFFFLLNYKHLNILCAAFLLLLFQYVLFHSFSQTLVVSFPFICLLFVTHLLQRIWQFVCKIQLENTWAFAFFFPFCSRYLLFAQCSAYFKVCGNSIKSVQPLCLWMWMWLMPVNRWTQLSRRENICQFAWRAALHWI